MYNEIKRNAGLSRVYSFFVLGLIPGTNFQITFQVWLDCLMVVFEVAGLLWLQKRGCFDELIDYLPPAFVDFCIDYYVVGLAYWLQLKIYVTTQWTDFGEVIA